MPLLRVMADSRSFGALLAAFIIAACVHALCAQFIRAEGHTTLYAVQGLLNTALYIALNVLFLTVFCWGVMGYLLSTVFMDVWQLSAIAESGDRRAQARFYARVWDAFFSAVCLCAGGIIAFSPLLIRLLAAESYPVLGHRLDDFDENGPPLRLCGHPARGAHRLFVAASLCPFSQRCACRGGAGCYDRRASLLC